MVRIQPGKVVDAPFQGAVHQFVPHERKHRDPLFMNTWSSGCVGTPLKMIVDLFMCAISDRTLMVK
jgi:hypothetical protein